MGLDWARVFVPVLQEQNVLIFSDVKQLSRFCSLLPEASERGNSLIGKKLHYRGIQSLFLTKRKELWLSTNGRFRMRSRFARNCGYAGMEDLECTVNAQWITTCFLLQLIFVNNGKRIYLSVQQTFVGQGRVTNPTFLFIYFIYSKVQQLQ